MANLKLIIVLIVSFICVAGCFEPAAQPQRPQVVTPNSVNNQPVNSIVGEWKVTSGSHGGVARFKENGMVDLESDVWSGSTEYTTKGGNVYHASYLWYSVDVLYDPLADTLKSTNQDVKFVRIKK
jgi:hypothetical protein